MSIFLQMQCWDKRRTLWCQNKGTQNCRVRSTFFWPKNTNGLHLHYTPTQADPLQHNGRELSRGPAYYDVIQQAPCWHARCLIMTLIRPHPLFKHKGPNQDGNCQNQLRQRSAKPLNQRAGKGLELFLFICIISVPKFQPIQWMLFLLEIG